MGWPIAERAVRPFGVVEAPPMFDQGLSFMQRVEGLAVQAFVPQLGIVALVIDVLLEGARCDEQSADLQPVEPGPDSLSDELGAIVGANMFRRSSPKERQRRTKLGKAKVARIDVTSVISGWC